ncbi:hypothetical protein [Streptomyces sp. Wb2n-11]|uniref:hypothetical protein n=1 Tax=Streptomyces sp. Wb2n-11 TaxID=1030533 RepID=UPI000AD87E2C|nr:hypothetical protein [Streptomyces sp. Wb2n-11]
MDIAIALLALVLVALMVSVNEHKLRRTNHRIARLEQKIDRVMEHLGIHESDPAMDQVAALAREGKKIQAVKLYRDITGADLLEAKNAVDRLESQA